MSSTNSSYARMPVGNGVKFAVISVLSPAERFPFSQAFLALFPAYFAAGIASLLLRPLAALDFALIRSIALALIAVAFVFAWFKFYKWISAWIEKKQTTLRHVYPMELPYTSTVAAGSALTVGVAHVIAGGLTEICAYGLMTDIGRALEA